MAAPTVVSVTPADATVGVSVKANIVVVFSVAIDIDSVKDGTVVLTNLTTSTAARLAFSLSSDKKTLTIAPHNLLTPQCAYSLLIAGADSELPAGNVESDTGDDLAEDYTSIFSTGEERFVSLEEITDRDDIQHIAPIREESELAEATNYIQITGSSPASYSTNQSDIDEIKIYLSEAVDEDEWSDSYLTIEMYPVLDLDDYIGNYDSAGDKTLYCDDSTIPITVPTGTISISSNVITWTRDTTVPVGEDATTYNKFPFNMEVIVTLAEETTGTSGNTLSEDVSIIFTTEMFPMYSGIRTIRLDLGPVLDDYRDDALNRVILSRSIDAWEIGGRNFSIDTQPSAAKAFTRWASVVEALEVLSADMDMASGVMKQLGDFRIDYSRRGVDSERGRIKTARTRMEKAERVLILSIPGMKSRIADLGAECASRRVFHGTRMWNSFVFGRWYDTSQFENTTEKRIMSTLVDQGGSVYTFYGGMYKDGYVQMAKL